MSADLWSIVAAVSAVVQAIVMITALLFVIAQLRESARARSTEAMRQVFEALARPGARLERRFVYQSAGANFDTMSDEELQRLWNVAMSFNHVGLLIKRGYLRAEVVYDIYGEAAVKCWRVLKPLVEQERKRCGEQGPPPYYLEYFGELANNSEEYLKKHYPNFLLLTYTSSHSSAGGESTAHFV